MGGSTKVAIYLHSGDYDRMHQGLSIAAAAVAAGRRAEVFLFWWALDRVARGALDEPDLPSEEINDRFERHGLPTLRQLWGHVRESGLCAVYACSGSLAITGHASEALTSGPTPVDQVIGWSTILQLTAGVTDRFYL